MTDVRLFQTNDGGEVSFVNGSPVLSQDGYESAVYLSLFGGNEKDSGIDGDKPRQWWGNLSESDPARTYRSETQNLLRSLPATAGNLKRVEDAANRDLAWMLEDVADAVVAQVSIPRLNAVQIDISVEIDGTRAQFTFGQPWMLR